MKFSLMSFLALEKKKGRLKARKNKRNNQRSNSKKICVIVKSQLRIDKRKIRKIIFQF